MHEKIYEVINRVNNGITKPFDCLLNDADKTRVIFKTFNNVEGNRILINEFVGSSIAKALNLPIPDFGICDLDETAIVSNNISLNRNTYGSGFYSKKIDLCLTLLEGNEKLLNKMNNKEVFNRIILFDHLVYNRDRNRGNALFTFKKNSLMFYIIDNSHIFNQGAIWDQYQLKHNMIDKDYNHLRILEDNKHLYDGFNVVNKIEKKSLIAECDEISKVISEDFLDKVFARIPFEWMFNEEEKEVLKEYILYRLENIEQMCSMIVEYYKI